MKVKTSRSVAQNVIPFAAHDELDHTEYMKEMIEMTIANMVTLKDT